MPVHRRITILVVAGLALGLAGCGGSSGSGASSSISDSSPAQILSRARSAMLQQGSVHLQIRGTAHGTNITYSDDAGRSEGRQDITAGSMHALVLFVGGMAYIQGDQHTLASFFGMSPAASTRGAGKWISIPSGDSHYGAVRSGVSLSSAVDQILPSGGLTKQAVTTVDGRRVVGLHGEIPGSPPGTLYVAASGTPLPVEEVAGDSTGNVTVTFANWGESISLSAPSGAVPISSLGA